MKYLKITVVFFVIILMHSCSKDCAQSDRLTKMENDLIKIQGSIASIDEIIKKIPLRADCEGRCFYRAYAECLEISKLEQRYKCLADKGRAKIYKNCMDGCEKSVLDIHPDLGQ